MSQSSLEAPRLSLEFIRKHAKRLHKRLLNGEDQASHWFLEHHPRANTLLIDRSQVKLADIQWGLAREYGLASWPALVRHVENLEYHRRAIAQAARPLDRASTLHLRCGCDIREGLKLAGFCGAFLEFSDPFCQGPVPAENLLTARAEFISSAYGLPLQEVKTRQHKEYQQLNACWELYDEVVLWFEHDSYDQLILAYILSHMPKVHSAKVHLINIDRFPAIKRFNGLGRLEPEGLRSLWRQRCPVNAHMIEQAENVWLALTSPSPVLLESIQRKGLSELPFMSGAIFRHIQELPSRFNGLSLTQQLALEAIQVEPRTGGQIFGHLVRETEPRVFLGDLMFFAEMNGLRFADTAPFDVVDDGDPQPWPKRTIQINETGRQLLGGELDWSQCGPKPRWVGGVCLSETPWWRWQVDADKLLLVQH
ncbi:hypothetical protein BTA51_01165 [Hahella sp. CCB-MM4]|uniref:DUF1835 domain-containing protein n=1 Tax=Hahella sp. (strain CCB-MM4) TaxID=1926491 RepID=UPI000B9BF943|nr:DUF1835 domain-containing protein [Hahella sp. CCB-MM4]OZG75041.1 hypothetical protein BTA51_01165 [Hahella sp. CCB-MM4]